MNLSKNMIIFSSSILVIVISILLLSLHFANLYCYEGDEYSDVLQKCGYTIVKQGKFVGKTINHETDCQEKEIFLDNACYYDKIGFLGKTGSIILSVILVCCLIFLVGYSIWIFRPSGDENRKQEKKFINKEAYNTCKKHWAVLGKMPVIGDNFVGKFNILKSRPYIKDGKDFNLFEVFIDGCNIPYYNGVWTWNIPLNATNEEILSHVAKFAYDNVSLEGFSLERRKYPMTSPRDSTESLIESVQEIGDENITKELLKTKLQSEIGGQKNEILNRRTTKQY